MSEDANNFLLFKWLKRQQEEAERYAKERAEIRNKEDDDYYVNYLKHILITRKYNKKELVILLNLVRWNMEGRNFTDAQRSVIGVMYSKYAL